MAEVMKVSFGETFNLKLGGMQLEGPDGSSFRLWAELGMLIQDGGGTQTGMGMQG